MGHVRSDCSSRSTMTMTRLPNNLRTRYILTDRKRGRQLFDSLRDKSWNRCKVPKFDRRRTPRRLPPAATWLHRLHPTCGRFVERAYNLIHATNTLPKHFKWHIYFNFTGGMYEKVPPIVPPLLEKLARTKSITDKNAYRPDTPG